MGRWPPGSSAVSTPRSRTLVSSPTRWNGRRAADGTWSLAGGYRVEVCPLANPNGSYGDDHSVVAGRSAPTQPAGAAPSTTCHSSRSASVACATPAAPGDRWHRCSRIAGVLYRRQKMNVDPTSRRGEVDRSVSTLIQRDTAPNRDSLAHHDDAPRLRGLTSLRVHSASGSPEQWTRAAFERAFSGLQGRLIFGLLRLRLDRRASEDRVAGWKIASRGDDWLRLEVRSWLLDVHSCFRPTRNGCRSLRSSPTRMPSVPASGRRSRPTGTADADLSPPRRHVPTAS